MRLSVATTSVPGNLHTKLESISEAGFTGIELYEPDLTGVACKAGEIGRYAVSLGLDVEVLQSFPAFEGLTGRSRRNAFERLECTLDLMQALGAKTLLVGTSTHPESSGDQGAICSDLSELAERVASRNLRAALIALPWARHTRTEMQALELVDAVNSPALGLGLSTFFSLADGSQPSRLRRIAGSRLFHVQISDAPALDYDITQLSSRYGLLPGQGELPLAGFVRIIARLGYEGPWSLARIGDLPRGSSESLARDGFRALVSLIDEAARAEPSLPAPMPGLPPRVYPAGFEFIEFVVDKETRSTLTDLLHALCFRKERKHVSKLVELWRQGSINMLINTETKGLAACAFAEHGPSVCDMGLRVKDAKQTVTRATMLGTPEFVQAVGAGELDIPAVRGVGGTVVHFIDEKSDLHRNWDVDFNEIPKPLAIPPSGLRRIDHVAQTMHYHEMQSWLTYYTSTFEMEKTTVVDVADPAGVVLSQAIASPEGEIRLNLNGVDGGRTFAGAFLADQFGAGVQHIAFQTDDIFETSSHLARAGFSRLRIPECYYRDLRVHFGLDDSLVGRMQEGHILYDRNSDGEYFQIYSTPIFQGFFFEIVERRGGYQGYGVRNAPVRLAAQARHVQG